MSNSNFFRLNQLKLFNKSVYKDLEFKHYIKNDNFTIHVPKLKRRRKYKVKSAKDPKYR